MVFYVYLHGFASNPYSAKAQRLRDRFRSVGRSLATPDLNQDDFAHLSLSRQIQQVEALFPPPPSPVVVIGSSFGGLTAARLGDRHPQIDRIVLLAPAFGFLDHWLARLGSEQVQQWQQTGFVSVYHYGEQQKLPLHYGFIADAAQYADHQLQRPVPTLILHGTQDDVIPIQASQDYAAQRPWVRLIELDSDHALTDSHDQIWAAVQDFCGLPKSLNSDSPN